MKYIKQLSIIITISLLGEVLAEILPFTIPASVYGLFIMLIALVTKIIKVEQVKETSDFLMDVMPIMFVPASVGLMVSWGLLKEILIPVLIVSILGTIIVMIVSGKTVDGVMKLTGKLVPNSTTDGNIIETKVGVADGKQVSETNPSGGLVEIGDDLTGLASDKLAPKNTPSGDPVEKEEQEDYAHE